MLRVETILRQRSSVLKPQRNFLAILLTTLMYLPSKANFRNLSRYSHLHEKTDSRGFRRAFDFVNFNRLSLAGIVANNPTWAVAIECTFSPKSGNQTYGLDDFYNSQRGRAEPGLELSTLALVDVDYNTAYHLSSRQTPKLDDPKEPRGDWYLKHLQKDQAALPASVRHVLADGYYSKLNNHQLKAGGLKIGGLNRRLKENTAESRWFVPRPSALRAG